MGDECISQCKPLVIWIGELCYATKHTQISNRRHFLYFCCCRSAETTTKIFIHPKNSRTTFIVVVFVVVLFLVFQLQTKTEKKRNKQKTSRIFFNKSSSSSSLWVGHTHTLHTIKDIHVRVRVLPWTSCGRQTTFYHTTQCVINTNQSMCAVCTYKSKRTTQPEKWRKKTNSKWTTLFSFIRFDDGDSVTRWRREWVIGKAGGAAEGSGAECMNCNWNEMITFAANRNIEQYV